MNSRGGASTYQFMNDAGVSGLFFEDQNGEGRHQILRQADDDAAVKQFDAKEKAVALIHS